MRIKVTQITPKAAVVNDFNNFKRIIQQSVQEVLLLNGKEMTQNLTYQIKSGSRSGRIRHDGRAASAKGEVPLEDTGVLADSIDSELYTNLMAFGSKIDYSEDLEEDRYLIEETGKNYENKIHQDLGNYSAIQLKAKGFKIT